MFDDVESHAQQIGWTGVRVEEGLESVSGLTFRGPVSKGEMGRNIRVLCIAMHKEYAGFSEGGLTTTFRWKGRAGSG